LVKKIAKSNTFKNCLMNKEIEKLKRNLETLTDVKMEENIDLDQTNYEASIIEEANIVLQMMANNEKFMKEFKESFSKTNIQTMISKTFLI
jgi:chlorite dismutase